MFCRKRRRESIFIREKSNTVLYYALTGHYSMYETCQRYPIEGLVHTVERRIVSGWRYNLGV